MEDSVSDTALQFVEMYEAAEQATDEARTNSEKCRDYVDNKQWTSEEADTMQRRGQPVITDNVIAGKVNWLIGQEMARRTDPKAYPRTPQHEQGAEAATDAVRFVCDNQSWDRTRSAVWADMLVEGFGGVEVVHRTKAGQPEILINRYPWDRLFFDPYSREDDFSDARYKGAVIWMDRKDLERVHPKAKDAFDHSSSGTFDSVTYEDRPRHQIWGDKARNRIRVVMMWHLKNGVWHWVKFTKGYVFEEGVSPYQGEDGESLCPLIMQSAHVDRDNNRYGAVWLWISQQDEINKRRSKLLHLANSRQTMGLKGAIRSTASLKREMAKPDGHIEYEQMDDSGRPSFAIIPTNDMATSQFALLQEAKESISGMGATEALMGSADGDSGRAVLAKQQGAMQGITPLNDKLSHFTRNVYEAIWHRIRQLWTDEKWIRVTDDDRNVRFVGLNKPVTLADELRQYPIEEVRDYALRNGLTADDPRLQQPVRLENEVAKLEVDIIMQEVPDTVTLEAETFEQLVNIDAARGGILPIEMMIEASPLRSDVKDKIIKYFEDEKAAQQQGQQQGQDVQGQMAQLEMAGRDADIRNTEAKTKQAEADAMKKVVEAQRLAYGH